MIKINLVSSYRKYFETETGGEKNPVVRGHCYLTSLLRGLPHILCDLNKRKKYASFVPTLYKFFRKRLSYNFSKFNYHGPRRNVELNGECIRVISSESQLSLKMGCLTFLNSFRFLDDG